MRAAEGIYKPRETDVGQSDPHTVDAWILNIFASFCCECIFEIVYRLGLGRYA